MLKGGVLGVIVFEFLDFVGEDITMIVIMIMITRIITNNNDNTRMQTVYLYTDTACQFRIACHADPLSLIAILLIVVIIAIISIVVIIAITLIVVIITILEPFLNKSQQQQKLLSSP